MDSTQDMNPQGQPSQDTNGFLSPGVEENWGEMHEAEPADILLTEEGEKEMDTEPVPEQEMASEEGKVIEAEEEAKEDHNSGLDVLDTSDPMNQESDERAEHDEPEEHVEHDEPNEPDEPGEPVEPDEPDEPDELDELDESDELDEFDESDVNSDYSSDYSEEEPEEQEQEAQPVLVNIQRPRPWNRRRVAQRTIFTVMQMQELERIFHRYPFPDLLMRQDIARRMNVTEARVQIWFKNRRRRQRAFMWRNVHHMIQSNAIHINVGVPPNIIPPPQPAMMFLPHAWMWYPQPAWIRYPQPQALGLLLPPVAPYPPLFMPAPPQPLFFPRLPHVPHGGPHPHVWAWFVSVFYP